MERVIVYIDGANVVHGIRDFDKRFSDSKFDFEKFFKKITKGKKLIKIKYYTASLKKEPNPNAFKKQQKLLARLNNNSLFEVNLCKRQKKINEDGSESFKIKGDDIKLAVDMVHDGHMNKFDTAILMSGDGDFEPLVQKVKEIGKRVENIHFPNSSSYNLIRVCDSNIPMSRKIIKKNFYQEIAKMTLADTESGKRVLNE